MNNVADIGLVNSHPKGNSGNNDVYLIFHPAVLNIPLVIFFYVSVVEGSFQPPLIQPTTRLLAVFLR